MKTLYLNDNGDIEFNNLYSLKIIEGDEEVRQRNKLTLATREEEWFLNLNFGIPWFDLLGKQGTVEEIKQEIIKTIETDDAVESIDSVELDFDKDNRELEIKLEGILENGRYFQQTIDNAI
ncbi:DUF2634 domain-containing protein [Sporohalobacter salinus]|uniref:contractile injection system sheath initiator n=1 Tax=Sporohalobacter salinus TaxID=1494606 RepID=UPI001961A49B|nr:DUF2634 domain-containing protein [Sporohalobacter salinus]MBM7623639.1 hypothetical protein [Sporohalobacter salinus]